MWEKEDCISPYNMNPKEFQNIATREIRYVDSLSHSNRLKVFLIYTYSYKRGASRTPKSKSKSSMYLQAAFSCWLLQSIYEDCMIVNIDESSFSRSVKWMYSWLPKSKTSGIINTLFKGRTTLILALLTNGHWISMTIDETAKSEDFCLFLCVLKNFIEKWFMRTYSAIKLTFDNATVHLTKQCKEVWNTIGFEILTLPQYWPHLAPAELVFGMIKQKLRNQRNNEVIDFSKSDGKLVLATALDTLDPLKSKNLWMKTIAEARNCILNAKKAIDHPIPIGENLEFYQNRIDQQES